MLNSILKLFSFTSEPIEEELKLLIEQSIELTVKGTDPRLSQVSGYKKKLQNSVKAALEYIDDIVEAMHSPLEIGRRQFASDPQVHAFFGSANDIAGMIKRDRDIKNHLYKSVSEDGYIYLGMATRVETKNVLARKLVNGIVKKDVKRTAVNFSGHRFVDPSNNENELRKKIKERVFMTLIQASLVNLIKIKDLKHDLEEQKSLLNSKLRNYKKQALGLEPINYSENKNNIGLDELKTELAEIEKKLAHMSTNIVTLDQYIEIINEVMNNPGEYLIVNNSSIRMTRMNYTATLKDEDTGENIIFTDFQANQNRVIGRLIKISRDELQ